MVKRKLDGAEDESSADQEIPKSYATVHNLWRPAPSSRGVAKGGPDMAQAHHCVTSHLVHYLSFDLRCESITLGNNINNYQINS